MHRNHFRSLCTSVPPVRHMMLLPYHPHIVDRKKYRSCYTAMLSEPTVSLNIYLLPLGSFNGVHLPKLLLIFHDPENDRKTKQGKEETGGKGACPRIGLESTECCRDEDAGVGEGSGDSDGVECCVVGEGFALYTGEEALV